MRFITLLLAAIFLLTGCMTKNEAWLRGKNIDAQREHPTDYEVVTIKGPITLGEDAHITAKSPTQPFNEQKVPDGAEKQYNAFTNVLWTTGLMYWVSRWKGNTKKTTVNNYEGGTP